MTCSLDFGRYFLRNTFSREGLGRLCGNGSAEKVERIDESFSAYSLIGGVVLIIVVNVFCRVPSLGA